MAPMKTEPIFGIAVKHTVANDIVTSIIASTTSPIKKSKKNEPIMVKNDIIYKNLLVYSLSFLSLKKLTISLNTK
jgi:hypothetical protein